MKTVKINYACTGDYYDKKQNLIYDILKNNGYDVQIVDDPDYIICDVLGENFYEYCKYPQVRIMCSGENYIPDFNLIDYAISPYPIQFGDRHFQLPMCVWPREHWLSLVNKTGGGTLLKMCKINNILRISLQAMSRSTISEGISLKSFVNTSESNLLAVI